MDEFQNFVTDAFAAILSEARKYRLNLIITNQYIGQLVHDQNVVVKDAVFGNVGTFVAFRTGAEDVEFLEEKQFGPNILAQDLLNLPNYNVYLRLMIDGVPSRPFSAITLVPSPKPEISYVDEITEYSRKAYGTPIDDVEKQIAEASGVEVNEAVFLPNLKKPEFKVTPEKTIYEPKKIPVIQSFKAFCELCKKGTVLPFKPDGRRPVYCKDCFIKIREKGREEKNPMSLPPRIMTLPQKRLRKDVDTEGLKKILEEVLPKK